MTTIRSIKSMGRSPSRLALLLIPLVFACFALAQSAQAVGPEADEGDLIGNIAVEDDAVAELGSDTVKAAMGQAANNDNNPARIPINIIKPLQCAGGTVVLRGTLVVTFRRSDLRPSSLELKGFIGIATPANRKLTVVPKSLRAINIKSTDYENGFGSGTFDIVFKVTGPGLPAAGKPLKVDVEYRRNSYIFKNWNLKLASDKTPTVVCPRR